MPAFGLEIVNTPESTFSAVLSSSYACLNHQRWDRPDNVHVRWIYHHAGWSLGIQHPHDFFEAWRPYSLHGLERKLHQPLLCLFSEGEIAQTSKSMILETMQFLTAIEAPVAMRFFPRRSGAASHWQMGGLHAAQASIFDWLDDLMRLEPAP